MTALRPGQSPPPVRMPMRIGQLLEWVTRTAATIRHDVLMFPAGGPGASRGMDVPYDMTSRRLAVQYLWARGEPRDRTEVPVGPRAPPAPGRVTAGAHPAPAGAGAVRGVRRQPDHPAARGGRPGRRRSPGP